MTTKSSLQCFSSKFNYSSYFLFVSFIITAHNSGLPRRCRGKESVCQCRRCSSDPWVSKLSWRRRWQPAPEFLSEEFHGQRRLVGYSPWVAKAQTRLSTHTHTHTPTCKKRSRCWLIVCNFLSFTPKSGGCKSLVTRDREIQISLKPILWKSGLSLISVWLD